MMHDREKSDPAIVAVKPTNKAERSGGGGDGAKGGDQGKWSSKHAPDTYPGNRVTGAGAHTHRTQDDRASPSNTQGRSRMLESGPSGSVRGCSAMSIPTANLRVEIRPRRNDRFWRKAVT